MRLQITNLQRQLSQLGENDVDREQTTPRAIETGSPDMTFPSLDDTMYTDVPMTTYISPTTSELPHESAATAASASLVVPDMPSFNDSLGWVDWATDLGAVGARRGSEMGSVLADLALLTPNSERSSYMRDTNTSPSSDHMMLGDTAAAAAATVAITDDIRADLDQIFMERVRPVLPFIYWRRCLSWADQKNPGPARACLRSAMRTTAAAMSASSTRFCDQLYAETCALLQAFAVRRSEDIAIEYIQAWLLVGHFELLRVGEHQAVLTAGRCCRLVLMARLFEIDRDATPVTGEATCTFSDVEERRRTFWVAFCLDRLLCSRNQYPLTFQDDMICTRLPAPEANFQNNQPVRVGFLSETIMLSPPSSPLSPLAEVVVLATIHGWCMTYRRSYPITTYNETKTPHSCSSDTNTGCSCKDADRVGESGGDDFWTRQRWLASAIKKRLQSLGAHSTRESSTVHDVGSDPMLLFARMLAHSAVIRLGNTARQRAAAPSRTVEELHSAANFEYEASSAAAETVHLAGQIPSFGYFKVHPFLPDLLGCAATYLTSRSGGNASLCRVGGGGAQQLFQVLRDMQGMNSLARDYFQSCGREEEMNGQQIRGREFMRGTLPDNLC